MFLQKIVKDPLVSVPDQEVVDTLERKGVGSTSYSARSAAVGSSRVARPAGSKQANAATASRKAGTSTNVSRSTGVRHQKAGFSGSERRRRRPCRASSLNTETPKVCKRLRRFGTRVYGPVAQKENIGGLHVAVGF